MFVLNFVFSAFDPVLELRPSEARLDNNVEILHLGSSVK